jgi:hypothetical protein
VIPSPKSAFARCCGFGVSAIACMRGAFLGGLILSFRPARQLSSWTAASGTAVRTTTSGLGSAAISGRGSSATMSNGIVRNLLILRDLAGRYCGSGSTRSWLTRWRRVGRFNPSC